MANLRRRGAWVLAVCLLVAAPSATWAQDEQELEFTPLRTGATNSFWERVRLGAGASFYSGLDRIRSKSANFISFRDIQCVCGTTGGTLRFEPRVDPASGRITMSPVDGDSGIPLLFNVTTDFIRDPRKDIGARQETALAETLWGFVTAAYDVKSWRHGTLFVQLDAGHYQGDAGSIEVAIDLADQPTLNPFEQDPTADDPLSNFQFVFPSAGRLKQTPISLSGMWQFRPRSPLRPYAGIGAGYIFTSLDDSASLGNLNRDIAGLPFTFRVRGEVLSEGVMLDESITTDVSNAIMYTAQGGLEYNINRKWSVYVDARFIQTAAAVSVRVRTPDGQVFEQFGQGIQRSDGVDDVTGIGSVDALLAKLISLPVNEAVELISDIAEESANPADNERTFFGSFPVLLGDEVILELPNPVQPNETTNSARQTKLFVQGGDIDLDSFSMGVGFRYRY